VSLWIHPTELTQFTTTFFGARDSNNWVSIVPDGPVEHQTMVWSGSSRWYDGTSGMTVNTGEWTHLALIVNKGKVRFYVNGEQKFNGSSFPDIFTSASSSFSLGVNWWDPPFQGMIDELRVYDGALSQSEIEELYNQVQ
jgi:arabinan endo-1,5-alpha-L-arabinosidase